MVYPSMKQKKPRERIEFNPTLAKPNRQPKNKSNSSVWKYNPRVY